MEHYHVAHLNEEQLQQIKGLEKELDVILIAYDDEEETTTK
ncbi:hypothetical protein [Bacillus sp. FJAT-45350]|nr:hypothetical protein [Bacillus sp. FJAT-45350]